MLQCGLQVSRKSGATGTSSSEQKTGKPLTLEEISDKVSSLTASIPEQLIQKIQGKEQCCGTSDVCQSFVNESKPPQKNTGVDGFSYSPEVKFLDELNQLKLGFNSLIQC